MTFDEILAQVLDLLQRDKRLSYRALKVRFGLDDEHLAALKDEIIEAKQLAVDDRGLVLVWTGDVAPASPATASTPARAGPPEDARRAMRACGMCLARRSARSSMSCSKM